MAGEFVRTRLGVAETSQAALRERQQKGLRRLLSDAVTFSPAYRGLRAELECFPVLSKADFLERFRDLNRRGVAKELAQEVALRGEASRDFRQGLPGGLTVGLSSGTSGARHVFLADRWERACWAGRALARVLSPESLRRAFTPGGGVRIALFLRAHSNLYATVSQGRIQLTYFDLTRPFDESLSALVDLKPDIVVAPATVLAEIAAAVGSNLRPSQVVSVAEVLEPGDGTRIAETFGLPVQELYQAAEGFLGFSCEAGRLHLDEANVLFETAWVDEAHRLFHPVLTDFTRRTQWFVRYRLDDVLEMDPTPCPCGRVTKSLRAIHGRADEVLYAQNPAGAWKPVFPDGIRRAFYTIDSQPKDYRLTQHGPLWKLALDGGCAHTAEQALRICVSGLGLLPPEITHEPWTPRAPGTKRIRIHCHDKPL